MKIKHSTLAITALSIAGQEFEAGKGGVFDLPDEVAAIAIAEFGFELARAAKKDADKAGENAGE